MAPPLENSPAMMKDWQRCRLDTCLIEISKDLDIRDTILKLRVRNLINADDEQLIMNDSVHKIDSEKRQKIVEIIKTRGERAYWALCHIIKDKTPFIFGLLHKCEGEENVEEVCPDCKEEENLGNCNYCKGLINVLSNPDFGVFIEKPEEIVESFQNVQNEKEALSTEVTLRKDENMKLKEKIQQLLELKNDLTHQLESKESDLSTKEKEIHLLLQQHEDTTLQKEQLSISNDNLTRKIDILNKKNLQEEEADEMYLNHEEARREASEAERNKNISMSDTLAEQDKKTVQYKLKYETLEGLIKRQKTEHDRVFTLLETKRRNSDKSARQKHEELETRDERVKVLTSEKDEVVKQREHILKRLHEKDKVLKNTQKKFNSLKEDNASFQKLYVNAQRQTQELEQECHKRKNENQELNKRLKLLQDVQRESDNNKRKSVVSDNGTYLKVGDGAPAGEEETVQRLQAELTKRNNNTRPTDVVIELKKVRDIFGVKFGVKKGPILHGESRIYITTVNADHLSAMYTGAKVK